MRNRRSRLPPPVLKPPPRSVMKPPPPAITMKAPPVGVPPNPRRPRIVRDGSKGQLGDLFAVFPELPWPARPGRRVPARTLARRLGW